MKLSDMKWTGKVIQAVNDEKITQLLEMGFYSITYNTHSDSCSIDLKYADIKPDEFANYECNHMGVGHRFYNYATRKTGITIVVPCVYNGEERSKEILEMIFKEKEVQK